MIRTQPRLSGGYAEGARIAEGFDIYKTTVNQSVNSPEENASCP